MIGPSPAVAGSFGMEAAGLRLLQSEGRRIPEHMHTNDTHMTCNYCKFPSCSRSLPRRSCAQVYVPSGSGFLEPYPLSLRVW